jgi:hypothetical protein
MAGSIHGDLAVGVSRVAGDIRRLEVDGDNHRGWHGAVGNPVAPRLDLQPPGRARRGAKQGGGLSKAGG